jgi:hypothetical protein
VSEPFVYTGQQTTYEEWLARRGDLRPARYFEHDVTTGKTRERPDLARGGTPDMHPDFQAS